RDWSSDVCSSDLLPTAVLRQGETKRSCCRGGCLDSVGMIPSEPNLLEITTMKLNQLALAAAFLAVPFMAQADLRSLDDAALAGSRGQDGISLAGYFHRPIGPRV